MTTAPSRSPTNSSPGPEHAAAEKGAVPKHVTKLSTSSPEAIKVAAEITPHRLANLLIRKGPLAIRLITSHLSQEVPGFEFLSLSKQRRLIMAAMEQGDPENNVVFEKIGWGQWAVRHVDSDYIVTEPNASHDEKARISIHELREKAKLGWSKKEAQENALKAADRRFSISNNKNNLHNVKLPGENLDTTNEYSDSEQDSDDDLDQDDMLDRSRFRLALGDHAGEIDDNAIDEDSDEDAMEDDALFKFEDDDHGSAISKFKRSPPLMFANRVPTKFSPPPPLSGTRRKSSSAASNSVTKNSGPTRHQIFNRSRLNSLENLDDYIISTARNGPASVSSPTVSTSSVPSTSPLGSWNGKSEYMNQTEFTLSSDNIASALHNAGRRKSSFNESSIRSTLSSSLPRAHAAANRHYETTTHHSSMLGKEAYSSRADVASDTDEEDWATMGAERLKQSSDSQLTNLQKEEHTAATALVNLMGT